MHARSLCIPCWIVAFVILGKAAAGAAPERQSLQTGAVIERRLAGGEVHSYLVAAKPEARLLVTVEQRGIDVVVEALRPDGSVLIAVDGPTDSEGPEPLLLPSDALGPIEIQVRSLSPGAAPGAYTLLLEDLESAPAGRLDAERLMTEAAAHNRTGGAEGKRLAATRYEEARVLWRSLGNRRQEARCALAAAEIHTALGQPQQALEHHQKALALFVELADEPGQAATWRGMGLARTATGDFAGAVAAQRSALALERGLGRPYEEGKVLNNLGYALHSQGELREALGFYEQALEIFQRLGEKGVWEGTVLQNLAAVAMGLGEPEAALRSYREILERQRALGDRKAEARALNSLGVLFDSLGQFGDALDSYAAALAIVHPSGDRLWEAALLHNLGAAYSARGDFQRALANLEQALAIRREIGDKPGEARTETAIAGAWSRLGESARALDAGRRAAAVASTASDRWGEMLARRLLGEVNLAAGQPAAALPELTRALELARLLDNRADEALILRGLGEAHLALKQPEEAARLLAQAVDRARAVRTPGRILAALTALARAERALGRLAEARSRVEEALSLIETLRATETSPDLRASFLASVHAAFELAIDLLMELDRREPDRGHARAAFEVSERARARSLLDLLQEAGTDVRQGVDPLLRDRERALLVRLNAKAGRQASLLKGPATEKRVRAAEEEVRSALAELAEVEAEIRRSSPRYAALTQPPVARSGEIQDLLDGETLLLEYALGEERSFLWAVDRDSVTAFELPARDRIEAAAREVYSQLSVLAHGDGGSGQAAAGLSRMVLGPVAARLGGRRLIVVADGELQYIPFGVLPLPESTGVLLIDRHEIANAPSASTVALRRRLSRREPVPGAVAVLADPVFDPQDPRVPPRVSASAGAPPSAAPPLRSAPGDGPLLRLPWTRREAEAITAVAPPGTSLLALDFRASRETALSPELARYRIVHFATHGLIDSQTPALSGLMLSRVGEKGAPVDGFLGLGDVYNLRLGADLVVLSGCETALGKEVRGEGLVGLTQGFLYAGAKQVAASLWRVEDRATAELMSRFYRGLLVEGRPPAAALRLAQLAVRKDKRWRSPYYWSGFVLQGDWK